LIDLKIGSNWTKCLVDSGTNISVFQRAVVESSLLTPSCNTTIDLVAAFGDIVQTTLVNLPCCIRNSEGVQMNTHMITRAVTDKLHSNGLLTPQDYNDLVKSNDIRNIIPEIATLNGSDYVASREIYALSCEDKNDTNKGMSDVSSAVELKIINSGSKTMEERIAYTNNNVNILNDKQNISLQTENESCDEIALGAAERAMKSHDDMVCLQTSDITLQSCQNMAKTKKSEFFTRDIDKLLYRKTQMYGFQVYQLVLPESKRKQVIQLAHDSIWGGHFAFKKTLQRIQTTFYWPTMRQDIAKYTKSCKECQLKRRITVNDRVPITAVMRPPSFGDTLSIDVIGPLEPPSSKGHKYVLCVIDQTTKGQRWLV